MHRYIERAREESGFTLIELLIVIVILGILAGVVVFSVGGITDRGNVAACKTDQSTITVAVEAFRAKSPTGKLSGGPPADPGDCTEPAPSAAAEPGGQHAHGSGVHDRLPRPDRRQRRGCVGQRKRDRRLLKDRSRGKEKGRAYARPFSVCRLGAVRQTRSTSGVIPTGTTISFGKRLRDRASS